MADSRFSSSYDVSRTLGDFKEKLKHGYHVIKILENQLETARQNISLLQGQVRLATETINNLKQHYGELDGAVSFVLNHKGSGENISPGAMKYPKNDLEETSHVYHGRPNGNERFHGTPTHKHYPLDNESARSPRPIIVVQKGGQVTISEADNPEKPRSPYAQQLKQVLEALQDDDPNKKSGLNARSSPAQQDVLKETNSSHCSCPECAPAKSFMETGSTCGKPGCSCGYSGCSDMHDKAQESMRSRLQEEDSIAWKQPLRIEHSQQSMESSLNDKPSVISSTPHSMSHSSDRSTPVPYSGHCQGACCSSDHDVAHSFKVMDKGNGIMQYVSSSPPASGVKRESGSTGHSPALSGHCDDKCKCQAYVSYGRYGYQLVESASGLAPSISPNSSRRVKRPPPPLLPGDEPPHLKYTKVKRIDGSKLTAQKTIADFSKRRFHPYNPRYDLDLLIVPPPVPASELLGIDGGAVEGDIKSVPSSKEGSISSSVSEDSSTTSEVRFLANSSLSRSRLNSDADLEVQKFHGEAVTGDNDCLSKADVLNKNTITHDSNGGTVSRLLLKSEHMTSPQWSPVPSHQDLSPSQRSSKFDSYHLIHSNLKQVPSKMPQLEGILQRGENRCEQNGIGSKIQDAVGKAF